MKKYATSIVKFHDFDKEKTYGDIKEQEFRHLAHMLIDQMTVDELEYAFEFEIADPRGKDILNEHLHYLNEHEIVEFRAELK